MHIELRHVGVHRHDVVGQIAVNRRAVLRVVSGVFQKRHADSHHDRAFDLVASGERIDNAAGIDHRDDAAHAQPRDLRLPCDFDKVTSERVRRELRLFLTERRFGFAAAGDETKVGAPQQIREWNASARTIRFDKDPSVFETPARRAFVSRKAIPALSSRTVNSDAMALSAAAKTAGITDPVAIEPPEIGPSGSDVSPSATSTLSSGTPVLSAASCARIVYVPVPMSCVPHATRGSAIVAQLDIRRGGKSRGDSTQPRPFPSRGSIHRVSSSRLRDCASTSRTFPRRPRDTRDNDATKTECLTLVDLRLVQDAKSNGIDLELIGQFVHRRFGRVKSGDGAGAAHVGR